MTENFEDLLNEQFGENSLVGSVVKGTIIRLTPDFAMVDVGLKSEGRVPLKEFVYDREGGAAEKTFSSYKDFASLNIFVVAGGINGKECYPIIKIDNIRVIPNK